jgi:UPF0176 protein
MNKILNISAYKFVNLGKECLPQWQSLFKQKALANSLKGTILLSREGINLFLAGLPENIYHFQDFLENFPEIKGLNYRETWSINQPFQRMLVRLKKEIIAMGQEEIRPQQQRAPYIEPQTLREWYAQGKKMLVLDTRNAYEVEYGSFRDALSLNLKNFRSFPQACLNQLPEQAKHCPVVTFCTGGIRCEKAALWLIQQGYEEVYQLRGGILNYFEQCKGEFFEGQCFVFDERNTLEVNYGDSPNTTIS